MKMNKKSMKGLKTLAPTQDPDCNFTLKTEGRERNDQILKSTAFKSACDLAGIPQTRRQASKWSHKRGLAYTYK